LIHCLYCRVFNKFCYYNKKKLIVNFGEAHINKGERIRKSKLASLRRKNVRSIKKQKIEKVYRELRKARKNK